MLSDLYKAEWMARERVREIQINVEQAWMRQGLTESTGETGRMRGLVVFFLSLMQKLV
jgi:hypothetical protein